MERSKGKTTEADIQAAKTELHADAIKSVVFETFSKFQKLSQRGEKTFSKR